MPSFRSAQRLGRALALLALPTSIAIADAAEPTGMPSGMIFFYSGLECPAGSTRAVGADGRLLLAVTDPGAVGRTHGEPLADQEDRTHAHGFQVSVTLTSKSIAGASSCCNGQATGAATRSASGTSAPGSSGLPFIQYLVCVAE